LNTYFKLGIGPTRDFNNHVENVLFGVSKKRDIMERRDGDTVLFYSPAVLVHNPHVIIAYIPK
jgi:hypothetical protein